MISGTLHILGTKQKITDGYATEGAFDFNVAVKIAFRKGVARIHGVRSGDNISGIITLPMGDVEFNGYRQNS